MFNFDQSDKKEAFQHQAQMQYNPKTINQYFYHIFALTWSLGLHSLKFQCIIGNLCMSNFQNLQFCNNSTIKKCLREIWKYYQVLNLDVRYYFHVENLTLQEFVQALVLCMKTSMLLLIRYFPNLNLDNCLNLSVFGSLLSNGALVFLWKRIYLLFIGFQHNFYVCIAKMFD